MTFDNKNTIRWAIIGISFLIISLILWNTYVFFQKFKAEERTKMNIWTLAQKEITKSDDLNTNGIELHLEVLRSNTTTPMIVIQNSTDVIYYNNIKNEEQIKNPKHVKKLLKRFKNENEPIHIRYKNDINQTLYYGNSPLLNKLKYYPLALLLIILLFGAVVYFFYRSTKTAAQNKLWSGMAKETAHQIGTPLSSLIGWTEILKLENINPEYITEIEKDIQRLKIITERFSKIGSLPKLTKTDVVLATTEIYEYIKSRSSKLIHFIIIKPKTPLNVNLNPSLYSWAVENVIKNGIDAMKGKGELTVSIETQPKTVNIKITDTGKGLPKTLFNTIFEPGYTSKKRGWGLGLSLTKRIIENFHNGKIKVLHSQINKGTTLQITLDLV